MDEEKSSANPLSAWLFASAMIGLFLFCCAMLGRSLDEMRQDELRIEIQVGEKAPAPLERPEARSTFGRKVNTMKVREEVNGVKQDSIIGAWIVLGPSFRIDRSWLSVAQCDCGRIQAVKTHNLASLASTRCASCRTAELNRKRFKNYTSKAKQFPTIYGVWRGMLSRCHYEGSVAFGNYGARGISVCDEWRNGFDRFCDWAIANGYKKGLTIDRRNVNGNYEPQNCHFITNAEQQRNKRNSARVSAFGETKPMCAWGEDPRCIVKLRTLRNRINYGWDPEEAMTTPLVPKGYAKDGAAISGEFRRIIRPKLKVNCLAITAWGITKSLEDWISDHRCLVSRTTLFRRLSHNWPAEEAISNAPWRKPS